MTNLIVACIPAYNEAHRIASVLEKTKPFVDQIIVCDDGSSDETAKIAEKHNVHVVRHEKNQGYGAALKTLFIAARNIGADIVVTLDSDGQHSPEEIPRVINHLIEDEMNIVIGSRFLNSSTKFPLWRKIGIKVINSLTSRGLLITDTQSGFRAYSKTALESIALTENGMGISTEILLKAEQEGLKVGEVPITVSYYYDSSTHNPVLHGLSVVYSSLRHITVKQPFVILGIPYLVSILLFSLILVESVYGVQRISELAKENSLLIFTTLVSGVVSIASALRKMYF